MRRSLVDAGRKPDADVNDDQEPRLFDDAAAVLIVVHKHALRTLDALQLASFGALREDGPATFGCADSRLCAVAALRGHTTFNPVALRS